jgi:hypothetical protein
MVSTRPSDRHYRHRCHDTRRAVARSTNLIPLTENDRCHAALACPTVSFDHSLRVVVETHLK